MSVDITLRRRDLAFISIGQGKVHARQTGFSAYGDALDTHTLCGRAIPEGTQAEHNRWMGGELVCRRCIASLRTYSAVKFQVKETSNAH